MFAKRIHRRLVSPWLVAAFLLADAAALGADEAPRFQLPIDCDPGKTCWIVNYVDDDPSAGERDYACGGATYDGHKGTDFAVRDLAAMRLGVAVLAAADGEVIGTRDGMRDVNYEDAGGRESVRGRECGNGVAIQHAGGVRTQYCHMLRNSVRVKKGDKVKAGDRLGLVGHSGLTEFPHLHFQVMRDENGIIDPFVGPTPPTEPACGSGPGQMWAPEAAAKIPYEPTAIYSAGFAARAPKVSGVHAGLYQDEVLSRRAPALFFWADIFRVREGDRLTLTLTGPDGEEVVSHANVLDRTQAQRFAFVGRKRKPLFWPEGVYRGEAVLTREMPGGAPREFRLSTEVTLR